MAISLKTCFRRVDSPSPSILKVVLQARRNGCYGQGLEEKRSRRSLELVEETWADEINVLNSLAPVRPGLDEKKNNKLLNSFVVNDGDESAGHLVRQVYLREAEGERATVMVFNWQEV
ncbi:hypothetical protein F5884DRAFT_757505 [Xylogone sp. PMI_703]|nr:hypothetical protein F5884DRAFT_757505 [Xylogone sp. PMI_703]